MEKNLPAHESKVEQTCKTGRYLKYAIGEIVRVVIGILIALSIHNWNDNKKNENRNLIIITEY